jgi:diacylglycerol O-acyltransferase
MMSEFMRESDAFSWYLESDPVLRSIVVSAVWLESEPNWENFVQRLDGATRLAPYFRQRLVGVPFRLAPPRWVVDPDFDLECHLDRIYAPPGCGDDFVVDFARREAMRAFDHARPLWHFTMIEGLDGGRAALVMRMHHSLVDGVGAIQLAYSLFDEQAAPDRVPDFPAAPRGNYESSIGAIREEYGQRALKAIGAAGHLAASTVPWAVSSARRPVSATRSAFDLVTSIARTVAPVTTTMSPIMGARGLRRHLGFVEVPVTDLKAASKAANGSINDGFLAAAAGGISLYHEALGSRADHLRLMMPINLRLPSDPAGGNRITLMRFEVPAGERDPARRIAEVGRRSKAARHERSLPHTNSIAGALNLLPPAVVASIFKHVDFVASDVPGLALPVYLAGARVSRQVAFGPTTGTAMNLTLLSYCDSCSIGVTMDTAAVSDPDLMMKCLSAGFEEVLGLAGRPEGAERRRPPVPVP